MTKGISYKKRNMYLWAGTGVVLFLAYVLAFDKTITLFAENRALENRLAQVTDAPQEVNRLAIEAEQLQRKMRFREDGQELRQEVVSLLDEQSLGRGMTLKRMKAPAIFHDGAMQIETYEIVLEGTFIPLLKCVFNLEQKMTSGRIAGVKLVMEKDQTTRKEVLLAYVYVQTSRKYEATEDH